MTSNYYTVTITVYDRAEVYARVSELLHEYAESIVLRVGHPIKEMGVAVIFLLVNMNNDDHGAFSGRLGQLKSVKVKSNIVHI